MPHLILEYSANLERSLDMAGLLRRVHQSAVDLMVFPLAAIRVRAEKREQFVIAHGEAENSFIHLLVRIKAGRSDDEKNHIGSAFFQALAEPLTEFQASKPLALTVEVEEITAALNFAKNSIPNFMRTD